MRRWRVTDEQAQIAVARHLLPSAAAAAAAAAASNGPRLHRRIAAPVFIWPQLYWSASLLHADLTYVLTDGLFCSIFIGSVALVLNCDSVHEAIHVLRCHFLTFIT